MKFPVLLSTVMWAKPVAMEAKRNFLTKLWKKFNALKKWKGTLKFEGRAKYQRTCRVLNRTDVFRPKGTLHRYWSPLFNRLVPTTVKQSLASEIRRRAALQFLAGNLIRNGRSPLLLSFIGISIASEAQCQQAQIYQDICETIQGFAKPIVDSGPACIDPGSVSLMDFELGQFIDKGCDASVYEARWKKDKPISPVVENSTEIDSSDLSSATNSAISEFADFVVLDTPGKNTKISEVPLCDEEIDNLGDPATQTSFDVSKSEFNLAMKVMFNYFAESNASCILEKMRGETVPAQNISVSKADWEKGAKNSLPPHPNIVDMSYAFVDDFPDLPKASEIHPHALPRSLHPEGCGRNKTLFLVMKRYSLTMRDYLDKYQPNMSTKIMMLAQLVEAVIHMRKHGVVHRDLKSNNILVDISQGVSCPWLAVADFGHCLAEPDKCLKVPFNSRDVYRPGNVALQAPEIVCAKPGKSSVLDYSNSDLWAVGALAYEIFSGYNPFYQPIGLNATYRESELPSLPDNVPDEIKQTIQLMLKRDPRKRPQPEIIANMLYLYLRGYSQRGDVLYTSQDDLLAWSVCQTIEMLQRNISNEENAVEHCLKAMFLSRLSLSEVMIALLQYKLYFVNTKTVDESNKTSGVSLNSQYFVNRCCKSMDNLLEVKKADLVMI